MWAKWNNDFEVEVADWDAEWEFMSVEQLSERKCTQITKQQSCDSPTVYELYCILPVQ